eukprot:6477708-Amphidinium_carterae.2
MSTGSHTCLTDLGAQFVSKPKDNQRTAGKVYSKSNRYYAGLFLHQIQLANQQEVASTRNLDRSGNNNRYVLGNPPAKKGPTRYQY